MTPQLLGGLALALGSSAALNWGYLLQHGAAAELPQLTMRHPVRSLRSLFADSTWLIGFCTGIGGWAMYVAALWLAPLSLVQATSAGGIGLLALLVQRRSGERLPSRDWVAVGLAVAGLVLLGVSLAGGSSAGVTPSWLQVGGWIAASVALSAFVAGPASRVVAAGAGLGIAAGVLYAAGDVGTKAAVHGHMWLLLVPIVLACHGLAFVALQFGFQRGGALATAGVASLLTNALPIVAGIAIFHETIPGGSLGIIRALAFVSIVAGAALLARQEGDGGIMPVSSVVLPAGAASSEAT